MGLPQTVVTHLITRAAQEGAHAKAPDLSFLTGGSPCLLLCVYTDIVKDIGREMQLPVVDIFNALQQVPDWTTAAPLPDGLHLHPVGNRVVHAVVLTAIKTHYPAL